MVKRGGKQEAQISRPVKKVVYKVGTDAQPNTAEPEPGERPRGRATITHLRQRMKRSRAGSHLRDMTIFFISKSNYDATDNIAG